MAVASFQDLCAGLCDLVNVPTPTLGEDALGRVGFHVVVRGATVNLVHCPHACPDHVFVLFEFGPVGQSGPDSFADLQALLDANFVLLQVNPPVFSRNPATGEAVLQYVFQLFDASPHDLHALIERGVQMVERWHADATDVDADVGQAALLTHNPPARDISQFA
ncbi:CesT family type III secretion system chaperone [Caenimonas koreensis]|nr:CesT family type III secretion system chaperone [Caenimonas koreensis]